MFDNVDISLKMSAIENSSYQINFVHAYIFNVNEERTCINKNKNNIVFIC